MEHKKKWSVALKLLPSILVMVILPATILLLCYLNETNASGSCVKLKKAEKETPKLTMKVDKKINVQQNANFDITKYVTAKEGKEKLGVYVIGEVDTKKPGVYTLKVSATDSNGNFIQKDIKVTVLESQKSKEEKNETTKKEETEKSSEKEKKDSGQMVDTPPVVTPATIPSSTPAASTPSSQPAMQPTPSEQPAQQPAQSEDDSEAPEQGSVTYYPSDSGSTTPDSGLYDSVDACRAAHATGECLPTVGADGTTVNGYSWVDR